MTTANKITIFRILLIPFFVVEVLYYAKGGHEIHRLLSIVCFGAASVLDGVDGYIARHYNQRSELGAILDPLADKLLLVCGIILFSFDHLPYLQSIPLWLTGAIIGRDILLLVGKIATVLQMIVVLWILLKWGGAWLTAWTLSAAICTVSSGLLYLWDGTRQLSAHPTSLPTPPSSSD
jgi:phosphatidylglycerophosphate synthase